MMYLGFSEDAQGTNAAAGGMGRGCTKDAMERQQDAEGIAGRAQGRQEGSRYL